MVGPDCSAYKARTRMRTGAGICTTRIHSWVRRNRDLLSDAASRLRWLARCPGSSRDRTGVADVPDLFAVAIGPSSLIVDGDVIFADDLDVPTLEEAIAR